MTENLHLSHAREVALSASAKASAVLQQRFGSELTITSKGHADFVTEVDSLCEEIIKEELLSFDDTISFMGEESSTFTSAGREVEIDIPSTCWIVDPLDGTSNFSHTFGAFSVSIALRVDNILSLGVVQAPVMGDLCHAISGQGAWRRNVDGSEVPLTTLDNGNHFNIFSTSVPFREPEYIAQHVALVSHMYGIFEDLRRVGSAALDLMWVAGGQWAQFIELFLKPWDVAAGALLVREAGGVVTDFRGDENAWLVNGQVLASANARVHEQTLSLIE